MLVYVVVVEKPAGDAAECAAGRVRRSDDTSGGGDGGGTDRTSSAAETADRLPAAQEQVRQRDPRTHRGARGHEVSQCCLLLSQSLVHAVAPEFDTIIG